MVHQMSPILWVGFLSFHTKMLASVGRSSLFCFNVTDDEKVILDWHLFACAVDTLDAVGLGLVGDKLGMLLDDQDELGFTLEWWQTWIRYLWIYTLGATEFYIWKEGISFSLLLFTLLKFSLPSFLSLSPSLFCYLSLSFSFHPLYLKGGNLFLILSLY